MKYLYLIILSFLFVIAETKANTPLKPFEFEISLGGTYGIDKYVTNRLVLLSHSKEDTTSITAQ